MKLDRFKKIFGLILALSLISVFNPPFSRAESARPASAPFEYPARLYLKKDYYRAVTEILRLKFRYPRRSIQYKLDLCLLKSYYHLKDYRRAEFAGRRIIRLPAYRSNLPLIRETGVWLSGALLRQNKETEAALMWTELVGGDGGPFPLSEQIPGLIDPERVRSLSLFPGLGLAACGEYGKAAVSFLLNALFVGAAYHYFQRRAYGLSALFLFFETGWLKGGRNAAYEAAVNHNRRLADRRQKKWLRLRINRLFPERTDDFKVIYRNIPGSP